MHIDPFSIVVFSIIISLLMSAGLFVVSRDYLTDVKGIRYWATALLLLGLCWILFALYGTIPNFFTMVIGTIFGLLALVFYFHALMVFKGLNIPMRWLYLLVAIAFIGHIYFVHISFNMAGKIFVTSLSVAVLLLANSLLLLTKQYGVCPKSHRLTAAFFAFAACIYAIRAIYYLVWNTQPEQTLFQVNFIQDITYLNNAIFIVGTSFGFALMCIEKYFNERNHAIVAQQDTLNRLQKSEAQYRNTFEYAPIGISNVSPDMCFFSVNQTFCNMLGYSRTELLMMTVMDITHQQDKLSHILLMDQLFLGEKTVICLEKQYVCKDGGLLWGSLLVRLHYTVNGFPEFFIVTVENINQRKAAEEEIKKLAFFDPLTGLPNRRKLLDRLQYAIALNHRNQSQFAVFMMDLDKFKAVNDKLGHAAGDELLKQVAARITNCLRDSDMVARLGGDEFVLVLENLKIPESAETIALKVIADLTLPFQLSENNTVQIGASIGISLYPQHGSTPEILMDHADTALYQAKDNGRGCFAYFSI
jgi:diguanylate cyclase (GGDEF)-like protein/PAS domain S-box-containing protein